MKASEDICLGEKVREGKRPGLGTASGLTEK